MLPLGSTIACDLDDCLVATFANLYNWHNETYGTDLVVEKDCIHFAQWLNRGFGDYHTFMSKFEQWSVVLHQRKLFLIPGAAETLKEIKGLGFKLVIITSRRPEMAAVTREFVQTHFPNTFDEIWISGAFRDHVSKDRMDPVLMAELLGSSDGRNDSRRNSSVFVDKLFGKKHKGDDTGRRSPLFREGSPGKQHAHDDNSRRSSMIDDRLHGHQHVPEHNQGISSILFDKLLGKHHGGHGSPNSSRRGSPNNSRRGSPTSSRRSSLANSENGFEHQVQERTPALRWMEAPKSTICKTVGAAFLIDDSIHNALEVIGNGPAGIHVALFGDYLWNRHWTDMRLEEFARSYEERRNLGYVDDLTLSELPDTVRRCYTWKDVLDWLRG